MGHIIVIMFVIFVVVFFIGVALGSFWEANFRQKHPDNVPQLDEPEVKSYREVDPVSMPFPNDHTFGVRLLGYLQNMFPDADCLNQVMSEEYDYLCLSACQIIRMTFEDPKNKWYFNNMAPGCETYQEFISKWYHSDFNRFLKTIKAY